MSVLKPQTNRYVRVFRGLGGFAFYAPIDHISGISLWRFRWRRSARPCRVAPLPGTAKISMVRGQGVYSLFAPRLVDQLLNWWITSADLVAGTDEPLVLVRRKGGRGSFTATSYGVGGFTHQPVLADLNSDGFLDIVVTRESTTSTKCVAILLEGSESDLRGASDQTPGRESGSLALPCPLPSTAATPSRRPRHVSLPAIALLVLPCRRWPRSHALPRASAAR